MDRDQHNNRYNQTTQKILHYNPLRKGNPGHDDRNSPNDRTSFFIVVEHPVITLLRERLLQSDPFRLCSVDDESYRVYNRWIWMFQRRLINRQAVAKLIPKVLRVVALPVFVALDQGIDRVLVEGVDGIDTVFIRLMNPKESVKNCI